MFHIDDLPSGQNRSTEEAQIGGAHQFDSFQGGKIWNWKGVMDDDSKPIRTIKNSRTKKLALQDLKRYFEI